MANDLTKRTNQRQQDVLSAALGLLDTSGSMFFRGSFAAPWSVDIPPTQTVLELLGADPAADTLLLFHTVLRGAPRLSAPGLPEDGLSLSAGDLVVLHGSPAHQLGEGEADQRFAMQSMMARHGPFPLLVDHGPNDSTTMICGGFILRDTVLDPMLKSLPPVVHVRADQASNNIATVLRMMGTETDLKTPGKDLFVSRLNDLLLIEVLRTVGKTVPGGWLAATIDPVVGPALAAMHASPEREWTLPTLAKHAGASRSGFSRKFRALVGEPPGTYLTRLRMRVATRLLRDEKRPVGEVAELVGYASIEGFSRTFKRTCGVPPSRI